MGELINNLCIPSQRACITLYKMLNKRSSWSNTPWRSCGSEIMINVHDVLWPGEMLAIFKTHMTITASMCIHQSVTFWNVMINKTPAIINCLFSFLQKNCTQDSECGLDFSCVNGKCNITRDVRMVSIWRPLNLISRFNWPKNICVYLF